MIEVLTEPVLQFDSMTHTYTVAGEELISVTQALKVAGVIDYSQIPQDVLIEASRRGTMVHRAIHYWLDGDLDPATVEPAHQGYVEAAKRFIEDTRFEPMHVERRDWHRVHRYAGTFDLDGLLFGRDLATVDWKTGIILPGHAAQLAGYNNFRQYPRTVRRIAVQLRADGNYRAHEYPSAEHPECTYTRDIGIFLSALGQAKKQGASN